MKNKERGEQHQRVAVFSAGRHRETVRRGDVWVRKREIKWLGKKMKNPTNLRPSRICNRVPSGGGGDCFYDEIPAPDRRGLKKKDRKPARSLQKWKRAG